MLSECTFVLNLCNYDDQLPDSGYNIVFIFSESLQYFRIYYVDISLTDGVSIKKLWTGQWSIENHDLCKELLNTKLDSNELTKLLKMYADNENKLQEIFYLAVNAFLTYIERNWSPHAEKLKLEEYLCTEWPKDINVSEKLQRDSEPIFVNILYPELLYLASQVFSCLYNIDQNLVSSY